MENLTDQITAKFPLEIKTYDIDIAGHVNNIVYVQWFEELRTALFQEYFNLPELLVKNLYPVVISTEISYKKILRLFDHPAGKMSVECCAHGIFTLKAEITLDGKPAAVGKQKCAVVDLRTSEIVNGLKLKEILTGETVERFNTLPRLS